MQRRWSWASTRERSQCSVAAAVCSIAALCAVVIYGQCSVGVVHPADQGNCQHTHHLLTQAICSQCYSMQAAKCHQDWLLSNQGKYLSFSTAHKQPHMPLIKFWRTNQLDRTGGTGQCVHTSAVARLRMQVHSASFCCEQMPGLADECKSWFINHAACASALSGCLSDKSHPWNSFSASCPPTCRAEHTCTGSAMRSSSFS